MEGMEKALQNVILKAQKYDELAHVHSKGTLHCSFCGKRQEDVRKLVAGPGVYICDECINLCQEIVIDEVTSNGDIEVKENTYKTVYMAYELMRNLLNEMKEHGDLKGYHTNDVFNAIQEVEGPMNS